MANGLDSFIGLIVHENVLGIELHRDSCWVIQLCICRQSAVARITNAIVTCDDSQLIKAATQFELHDSIGVFTGVVQLVVCRVDDLVHCSLAEDERLRRRIARGVRSVRVAGWQPIEPVGAFAAAKVNISRHRVLRDAPYPTAAGQLHELVCRRPPPDQAVAEAVKDVVTCRIGHETNHRCVPPEVDRLEEAVDSSTAHLLLTNILVQRVFMATRVQRAVLEVDLIRIGIRPGKLVCFGTLTLASGTIGAIRRAICDLVSPA